MQHVVNNSSGRLIDAVAVRKRVSEIKESRVDNKRRRMRTRMMNGV